MYIHRVFTILITEQSVVQVFCKLKAKKYFFQFIGRVGSRIKIIFEKD